MRAKLACLGLCLYLGLAAQAQAQQQGSGFWPGVSPRSLNFKPMDTTRAMKTYNTGGLLRKPAQQHAFNIMNLFHPFTMPSWPPKIGFSKTPPTPKFRPVVQSVPATRPLVQPTRSFFSPY